MKRTLCCILLAAITVCAAPPAPKKPKLVVTIIVDQFRYDYLLRFRDRYHEGLASLLEHGAVFSDAHYPHAHLVTAVGHSTFLSGATPSISGIIANEWWDRETSQSVTSVSDPKSKLVGGIPHMPGSSPRRLMVSTIADELKMADPKSKVIGVSIKDRSAILPAGHMANGAYWYDNDSNNWVSSDYYLPKLELPEWAKAVNAKKTYQQYLGKEWLPQDPKDGTKPFCTMVAGADARFCGGIEATPWGNEMIEAFAEAALAGEHLGQGESTDLLSVSFSSNDYVGHAVGPDDPAIKEISILTDHLIGKLLKAATGQVGGESNLLVVLSADHGVAPSPEVNKARKMPGERLSGDALTRAITAALTARFGPGKWVLPGQPAMIYLNLDLIGPKVNRNEVENVAAEAARAQPHISRVYTRHELLAGAVQQDAIGRAVMLGFYPARSADLVVVQEPYALFESPPGSSHGTPYDYDTHVPLIFMGPQVKAGVYAGHVLVNDVAPTLAQILGIETPSGSIGRVLTEILQ
jgi:predicted AlkP superfamily pyrophosphatase or phosphodiesterase